MLASFLCPLHPCSSVAATRVGSCAGGGGKGERGSQRGVQRGHWGAEHRQRRTVRKRCPARRASPRCPPHHWLSGLSPRSPACAGVGCWRLGHTINQNLPVPFDECLGRRKVAALVSSAWEGMAGMNPEPLAQLAFVEQCQYGARWHLAGEMGGVVPWPPRGWHSSSLALRVQHHVD